MGLTLRPSEIYFTQDSISEVFGDRGLDTETIEETFRQLLYGEESVRTIRPLTVVKKDGKYWVVSGNRRLYVYRKLESLGQLSSVSVNVRPLNPERFNKMYTTKTDGRSIMIRQDRKQPFGNKLDDRLNNIVLQWKRRNSSSIRQASPSFDYGYSTRTVSPAYSTTNTAYTSSSTAYGGSTSSYRAPGYTPRSAAPSPAPQPAANNKDDSWCVIL